MLTTDSTSSRCKTATLSRSIRNRLVERPDEIEHGMAFCFFFGELTRVMLETRDHDRDRSGTGIGTRTQRTRRHYVRHEENTFVSGRHEGASSIEHFTMASCLTRRDYCIKASIGRE
jgi:hypothetical protein